MARAGLISWDVLCSVASEALSMALVSFFSGMGMEMARVCFQWRWLTDRLGQVFSRVVDEKVKTPCHHLGVSKSKHWNGVWGAKYFLGINTYKRTKEEAGLGGERCWTRWPCTASANPMRSSAANTVPGGFPALGWHGQAFISYPYLAQMQTLTSQRKAWPWASWLSAAEATPDGANSWRPSVGCTPCSWTASLMVHLRVDLNQCIGLLRLQDHPTTDWVAYATEMHCLTIGS